MNCSKKLKAHSSRKILLSLSPCCNLEKKNRHCLLQDYRNTGNYGRKGNIRYICSTEAKEQRDELEEIRKTLVFKSGSWGGPAGCLAWLLPTMTHTPTPRHVLVCSFSQSHLNWPTSLTTSDAFSFGLQCFQNWKLFLFSKWPPPFNLHFWVYLG